MRIFIKNQVLSLLDTIKEAISYIENYFEDKVICIDVLKNCANALFSIESSLKSGFSIENYQNNYESNVQYLIQSIEYIASKLLENKTIGEYKKDLFKKIELIVNQINNDNEVKLEIIFLPYKASMWDSLESVWLAAKDDDKCNAYVVPIPYYDRDSTGRLSVFHYEGNDFSDYVPIHDYKSYVISARKPDIIYIHNPYDEYNKVTSVSPEYYSYNLKKHTNMLVYVPYYISGIYMEFSTAYNKIMTSGVKNADQIIVQSEKYKKIFVNCGLKKEMVQAMGTPKIDIINQEVYSEEWEGKIKEKKAVLINFTLITLLSDDVSLDRYEKIVKQLLEKNLFVIWRGHPLMEATLYSMRPYLIEKYKKIKSFLIKNENVIFDLNSDSNLAFKYSDAMISIGSSLVYKYVFTGKPILSMVSKTLAKIKNEELKIFDYLKNYFCILPKEYPDLLDSRKVNAEDNIEYEDNMEYISINDFADIVLNQNDYNKEKRLEAARKSIANSDGTCGFKTHKFIVEKCLGK